MKKHFFVLAAGFTFWANTVFAYIPDSQFIFSEAIKNHGKGPYTYETEVTFKRGPDTFTTHEKWLFDSSQRFSVKANGTGFVWAALVEGGRHVSIDTTGARDADPIPPDLYEPLLHTRSSGEFGQFLTSHKFVTPDAISFRGIIKKKDSKKDLDQSSHPQIRLARTDGVVAIAMGTPSLADGTSYPMVWMDQDRFLVKKIRTPSLNEVRLSNHANFGRGLRYPRTQTLVIDGVEITIQLKKMDAVNAITNLDSQLKDIKPKVAEGPLAEVVTTFYSRFR
ncbi:MAG: hypothetical protein K2X47_07180 [Bdellovibrionales bacterium]|nr:hypothetical protein [Bdellovibrionales bacterium]